MLTYRSNCSGQGLKTNQLRKDTKDNSMNALSTNHKSFLLPESEPKLSETPKNIDQFVINEIKKPNNQHNKLIERIKMKCLIEASIANVDSNLGQKENNGINGNRQSKFKQFISNVMNTLEYDSNIKDKDKERDKDRDKGKTYLTENKKDIIPKKTVLVKANTNSNMNKKQELIEMLYPEKSLQYFTTRSKANCNQVINLVKAQMNNSKNDSKDFFNEYKKKLSTVTSKEKLFDCNKPKQKRIPNSSLTKLSQLRSQLEKTNVNLFVQPRERLVYSKSQASFKRSDLRLLSKQETETEIKEFKRHFIH